MLRALVIDDSAYNRVTLTRLLEGSGQIKVVATAINGEDGIKQVMRHRPEVITADLEMPVMDGFAFLRWLMANAPTPVIVVSSRSSDRNVFKALELGAVDFVVKPGGRVSTRLEEIEGELVAKILQARDVKLENVRKRITDEEPDQVPTGGIMAPAALAADLIAIGASTGGPPALQTLFQSLPLLPLPIVVAQHMPPTFTRLFAERVNRLTHYRVKEGEDGEVLMPGVIYIAPGGQQTEVFRDGETFALRVRPRALDDLYAPSVDRLFKSASDCCEARLIAIILTGMGDDGAEMVPLVRGRGGRTIAEDASTAIIFGMPGEAIRTGAVEQVLPLAKIAEAITKLVRL